MESGRRRRRRYLRRRVLACAVFAAGLTVLGARVSHSDATVPPAEPALVVVEPGDTLWDIALAHTPPGGDPRDYLTALLAANDVVPSGLRPGTIVRVPAP